jgi:hypothetical protein
MARKSIQWHTERVNVPNAVIHVAGVPPEVARGIRMVTARRRLTVRAWLIASLYELIDRELSDYPEWRYQSERPAKKD